MIGIVSSRWQVRIVSKYLPDFENTCRRSTIALFLAKTRLILSGETRAPCQSAFAKQGWERSSYNSPLSAARSFKYSQLPAHRVPSRRDSDDQLRAVIGNTLRICGDNNEAQAGNRKAAGNRHKLYKEIILSIPLLVFTSAETARGDSFLSAHIRVSLNRYTYENITFDRSTGCMAYTVLATGGGGGQIAGGGKMVAVPWSVYSASSDVNTYTVTVDRERIYSAPVFDYAHVEEYSRPDYINNVYGYCGVTAGAAIGAPVSSTTGETHTSNVNTPTGTARGTSTRQGAMASPGTSAAAGAARSPAQAASPSGRGSPAPRATAERSPHETPAGRTHATPRSHSGATESSPTERTRGTKEEREESTPPSGRSET